jgi:hypothetical protein
MNLPHLLANSMGAFPKYVNEGWQACAYHPEANDGVVWAFASITQSIPVNGTFSLQIHRQPAC